MKSMNRQQLLGALFLSVAASIWGGVYVVSKVVLDVIPPFTLLEIRFLIAFLLLGPIVLKRKEFLERSRLPLLMAIGLIGVTISIGAQFLGTKLSSAHMGALITSASPAFIALFAVLLLKEKLTIAQIGGIVLATVGMLIVVGTPGEAVNAGSVAGNVILLVAALSWGMYTVLCKKATLHYSSLAVTAYAALFGVVFSSPLMFWELSVTPLHWEWSGGLLAGVLYIGVISTAVAFYLWNKGFELLQAGSGAGFFFFQPVVGAILGWLLLGEQLSLAFLIGAGFIFLGVALSNVVKQAKLPTDNKRDLS
ncbi:DMT family transporter [Brevibacillus fulvus]|uniref:Drug/metabolite transporter (DMT)-like permease n=1 Tax=Brevibacillus fulvus TaxID=1125967 RepID=A0A939BRL9_9BACL|nr:DMT family transporter [Brevibacillus fulvus]MBM7589772.1 drug/metabolite transporter (DMT)-like permease [Brevibacillus fulvus]